MAATSPTSIIDNANKVQVDNISLNDKFFLWNAVRIQQGQNNTQRAAQEARSVQDTNSAIASQNITTAKRELKAGNSSASAASYESVKDDSEQLYAMVPVGGDRLVDVVNDYYWTMTPPSGRTGTPSIYLREMQPKIGAELQNLLYTTGNALESITNTVGKVAGMDFGETANSVMKAGESAVNKTAEIFKDVGEKIQKTIESVVVRNKSDTETVSYKSIKSLTPYDGLYDCQLTGWSYRFPYFNNTTINTMMNSFSKPEGTPISYVADIATMINDKVAGIEATLSQVQSNAQKSTEQVKMYNYDANGQAFEIKFPLINTVDAQTCTRNYHLVQLLKYQSRPYRTSRNMIVPVNLYEVSIPGVRYIPYAFIQNINIELQGVRKTAKLNMFVDSKSVKRQVIIPEAYMVTISLMSLTNESQNFMIESMLDERGFINYD